MISIKKAKRGLLNEHIVPRVQATKWDLLPIHHQEWVLANLAIQPTIIIAQFCGVSPSTIRTWISRGIIIRP